MKEKTSILNFNKNENNQNSSTDCPVIKFMTFWNSFLARSKNLQAKEMRVILFKLFIDGLERGLLNIMFERKKGIH